MSTSIPADAKRFRPAVGTTFFFIFASVSISVFVFGHAIGIISILIKHGFDVHWQAVWRIMIYSIPMILLFAFIWAFVGAWIFSLFFPAWISSAGIHGHSFWGIRRFIQWQDVTRVRKFTFLNLPWLRVYSRVDGKVTWLPLFQSCPIEFQEEIRRFAQPNNLFLEHLKPQ